MSTQLDDGRAQMAASSINDLPDSDFAYIEPGGTKDATGKTVPRSKRHFPIHDAAHVRNALARAPQSPYGKQAMPKIKAAAKKFGIKVEQSNARPVEAMCVRSFDFEFERGTGGDGRTLEGYAAVFNSPARIRDWGGDFDEVLLPGAFARSITGRPPVMQWDHGHDPRVGTVPIAAIQDLREDDQGLHVRARLFDNPVVEPVRQAIEARAVSGMSFRFSVPDGGDKWTRRKGDVDLREISDTETRELGPVVFPAYDATSVGVRSMLASLAPDEHRTFLRELAAELAEFVDIPDLAGRLGARSTSGGGSGTAAGADRPQASPDAARRDHHLRMIGVIT